MFFNINPSSSESKKPTIKKNLALYRKTLHFNDLKTLHFLSYSISQYGSEYEFETCAAHRPKYWYGALVAEYSISAIQAKIVKLHSVI